MGRHRILVTGGAGYIGSHCVRALIEKGHDVLIFDNLSTGNRFAIEELSLAQFVPGDIRDTSLLEYTVKAFKPVAVIHFAAKAYVGESVIDPLSYFDNNVAGSISLLNAMRAANVRKIVFSSTCAVYGYPDQCPVDETQPTNPMSPYGFTKLAVEEMLLALARSTQLSSVVLRYFNAAGASSDASLGEWHRPETHLIPLAIRATYADATPLRIFGTDYNTADGTCERDYLHVEDLAQAHVAALDFLNERAAEGVFETFNLGVGTAFSVLKVLREVELITGRKVAQVREGRRSGDPARVFADPSKAEKILGWRAKRGLSDMIQSAYDFEKAMLASSRGQ
jgi:UDP-glucose-4-epimerase GalE